MENLPFQILQKGRSVHFRSQIHSTMNNRDSHHNKAGVRTTHRSSVAFGTNCNPEYRSMRRAADTPTDNHCGNDQPLRIALAQPKAQPQQSLQNSTCVTFFRLLLLKTSQPLTTDTRDARSPTLVSIERVQRILVHFSYQNPIKTQRNCMIFVIASNSERSNQGNRLLSCSRLGGMDKAGGLRALTNLLSSPLHGRLQIDDTAGQNS